MQKVEDGSFKRAQMDGVGDLESHILLIDHGTENFAPLNTLFYLPVQFSQCPPMVYKCRQSAVDTRDLTIGRCHYWRNQLEQTSYRVMVVLENKSDTHFKVKISSEYKRRGKMGYSNSKIKF